ncbi:hypothetical protein KM043_014211 [Ampulex compressa]|nr:hypothetical protein KM043_014211 [Ampulex compressa]
MMTTRRVSHFLEALCLASFVAIVAANSGKENCDITQCPGPLQYYKDLRCTPVYKNENDCCPIKYDCSHLENRTPDKCYMNNNVYNVNDSLREEDANPCDIGCRCLKNHNDVAVFNCAIVDCFHGPINPGCYMKHKPTGCCGEIVCPKKPEDRATCVVDGETYKDGEHFEAKEDPDLKCVCLPGYTGENVEPFCAKPKHPYCTPELRNAGNIYEKCAPVYYATQSPQTSCNVMSKCQQPEDEVISKSSTKTGEDSQEESGVCELGTLRMKVGDELSDTPDYATGIIKCKCEVPPIPTCRRIERVVPLPTPLKL